MNDDLTVDLHVSFDGAEDLLRIWRQRLRPELNLKVSDWADAHRWLSSRASAEPGAIAPHARAHLREIMDALSPAQLHRPEACVEKSVLRHLTSFRG
jgi:hypothetical protein